jgi:hypothetical protein
MTDVDDRPMTDYVGPDRRPPVDDGGWLKTPDRDGGSLLLAGFGVVLLSVLVALLSR